MQAREELRGHLRREAEDDGEGQRRGEQVGAHPAGVGAFPEQQLRQQDTARRDDARLPDQPCHQRAEGGCQVEPRLVALPRLQVEQEGAQPQACRQRVGDGAHPEGHVGSEGEEDEERRRQRAGPPGMGAPPRRQQADEHGADGVPGKIQGVKQRRGEVARRHVDGAQQHEAHGAPIAVGAQPIPVSEGGRLLDPGDLLEIVGVEGQMDRIAVGQQGEQSGDGERETEDYARFSLPEHRAHDTTGNRPRKAGKQGYRIQLKSA